MKFNIFQPLAVLATGLILTGCGARGGGSGDILATVQGEPITIDQFNNYLGVKQTARVIVQGQVVELPVADTLAFQAMQDLVSRNVLMQMAKDEGVMPNEKKVEDEIAFQKALDPNFLPNYQRRGMNIGQIRDEVKFSLVQEGLITKGITVTDDDVEAWMKRNPKAFVQPASVELSWILANSDNRKEMVDSSLKTGEKFEDVAIKLSQAPSAALMKGRYLPERGPLPIEALAESLKAAVVKGQEGTETDWIKFTEGWAKFYINKKNPESNIEITKERKENVRRNLALQRGNKANDLRKRLVDRIRTSDIVVRRESLKDPWKNFAKLLQDQAEQATQQQGGPMSSPGGVVPKSGSNVAPGSQ